MPNHDNICAPISLIGFGRSGTSLVSAAMAEHPHIDMVGESSNLIFTPWNAVDEIDKITRVSCEKRAAARDLVRYAFLRLFPSEKRSWFQKPIGTPNVLWSNFGFNRLDAFLEWYWDVFNAVFPESRNFSVIRHPYDVFLSAKSYWGVEKEKDIWRMQTAVMRMMLHPNANMRLVIGYRHLIENPTASLERICEAIDLDFRSTMVDAFTTRHVPAPDSIGSFSREGQWDAITPSEWSEEALSTYRLVRERFSVKEDEATSTEGGTKEIWLSGVESEIAFWRQVASGSPPEFLEDLKRRLDPEAPLLPSLVPFLPNGSIEQASILDVGAGPISGIGWHVDGKRPQITAIDALAQHYRALLDEFGHVPPVYTQACDGEEISSKLPANSFDIVHIRNALDQCYDVVAVVRQMLIVLKPGRPLLIFGHTDDAERASYHGLHQWNIRLEGDDLVIWRPDVRYSVREIFADRIARVDTGGPTDGWMSAAVWKR